MARYEGNSLRIDGIGEQSSWNRQMLNIHTDDGVRWWDGCDGKRKHTEETWCTSWKELGRRV